MSSETFASAGTTYKITIYAAPSDGKKHPVILLVHGNFGLGPPYGDQIHGFAKDLAGKGYMTAVPQYYEDDNPHLTDMVPHVQTLTDAIAAVASRPEADPDRLGLIGFPFERLAMKIRRATLVLVAATAISLATAPRAFAAAEDILVGAFDAVTGVPFGKIALGIVRSQESVPTTPENLDRRLRAVEEQLRLLGDRLRLVEGKVSQLQNDVVRIATVSRLRELQRIRDAIDLINRELQTHPTSPEQLAVLEFRAQQQADSIRDSVDFDIWKFSDIDASGNLRTRFRSLPAFELYALALSTWFSALDHSSQTTPQLIVHRYGAALREHAAFLQTRPSVPPPNGPPWNELRTDQDSTPKTLPEHLRTAVFCRLEASQKFADHDGNCTFNEVCYDNMDDTKAMTGEAGEVVLPMQGGNGALCTWNPDQPRFFTGEDELRNQRGLELMSVLAEMLMRMATTGSVKTQVISPFPNSFSSAVFSVVLARPMVAPIGSAPGVAPSIANCRALFSSCVLGSDTHQYHWTFDQTNQIIYHMGSKLCLDVKDNAPTSEASVVLWVCNQTATQKWERRPLPPTSFSLFNKARNLCVTVAPLTGDPRFLNLNVARSLFLKPCDGRDLQTFNTSDGSIVGPR